MNFDDYSFNVINKITKNSIHGSPMKQHFLFINQQYQQNCIITVQNLPLRGTIKHSISHSIMFYLYCKCSIRKETEVIEKKTKDNVTWKIHNTTRSKLCIGNHYWKKLIIIKIE